jgi:hypothetical protein
MGRLQADIHDWPDYTQTENKQISYRIAKSNLVVCRFENYHSNKVMRIDIPRESQKYNSFDYRQQ